MLPPELLTGENFILKKLRNFIKAQTKESPGNGNVYTNILITLKCLSNYNGSKYLCQ